jgi:DNA polymerase III delta prime subunit
MIPKSEKILKAYIDQKSLPHALLFVGQDVEAMNARALEFIVDVMTQRGASERDLRKIRSKNHPDVWIEEPYSKVGVFTLEQVKELCSKSQFYPHEAPLQFFIFKYAERMQPVAANALLKTLEEPTLHTHFILLAQSDEELPLTLKSRLQKVLFEGSSAEPEREEVNIQLQALLTRWPYISFDQLHLACLQIQEQLDEQIQGKEELDQALLLSEKSQALFSDIENWFLKLDQKAPFSLRKFERIFQQARIGLERSIKLSICLESLLINFI